MEAHNKKRVLVVEDDPQLRGTLSEILRWQGYAVDAAPHGQAALALAEVGEPDAILTDLQMPVMDGATFIRRC
jgi:CheY-like chemotaxis protein